MPSKYCLLITAFYNHHNVLARPVCADGATDVGKPYILQSMALTVSVHVQGTRLTGG